MKVTFKETGHLYESIPAISWTSVTKVVHEFTEPFDDRKQALKSSQNVNSKWYGIKPEDIIYLWDTERNRSTDAGSWWHAKAETKAIKLGQKKHRGKILKVYSSPFVGGIKVARDQVLTNGVYPEHLIFNEQIGVCGQSDLVFVCDGIVDVSDYKTNKVMDFSSYVNWKGESKMMLNPIGNLEDCNFYHYALQLSIYMKLILIKNPNLKPGKLELIHVNFVVDSLDEFGFPILKMDSNAYIVDSIEKYLAPYLEKEAEAVLREMYRRKKAK